MKTILLLCPMYIFRASLRSPFNNNIYKLCYNINMREKYTYFNIYIYIIFKILGEAPLKDNARAPQKGPSLPLEALVGGGGGHLPPYAAMHPVAPPLASGSLLSIFIN
eukprot:GHVU01182281.1.p1 GENE.GHVU01182281.1~~GHVU01182281.1.p1  ORF type:complete len:108 (+),score=1.08 GHVU01182281.1:413-736(+)